MAGCAFDSGFDSGFCVAEAEDRVALRGVPGGLRFRKLQLVALFGELRILVLGRGALGVSRGMAGALAVRVELASTLTVDRGLASEAAIVVDGTGLLARAQVLRATCQVSLAATAQVAQEVALGGAMAFALGGKGTLALLAPAPVLAPPAPALVELEAAVLYVAVVAFGQVRTGVACVGTGVGPATVLSGAASVGRGLEGIVDWGIWAEGVLDTDDEEMTLALLGLPSEVVI